MPKKEKYPDWNEKNMLLFCDYDRFKHLEKNYIKTPKHINKFDMRMIREKDKLR